MNTQNKVTSQIIKPVIVGATAFALSKLLNKDGIVGLPLINTEISIHTLYGGMGFLSSNLSETAKNWILVKYDQKLGKLSQTQNRLIAPLINGGINIVGLYLFYGDILADEGYLTPFLMGVGSEAGGTYGYYTFIMPYY
jgi:hypothetical protein